MMAKKKGEITIRSSAAEYLTFVAATGDNQNSFEMRYEDKNIWLTQKMMAELYDVSVQNIGQHIKRIFEDDELLPDSVIKKFFITAADGKNYHTTHSNILTASLRLFVKYVCRSENFIKKSPTYTRRHLIMTKPRIRHGSFSNWFKTNCTGLSTGIRRRS